MAPLPESVRIREVGPRDGFQNEPETIPTEEKVRLVDMLSASGLRRLHALPGGRTALRVPRRTGRDRARPRDRARGRAGP